MAHTKVSTRGLARLLAMITFLGAAPVVAIAADLPPACDPSTAAAAYDRQADEYQAAAKELYVAWALAHAASEPDGSARSLAREVARLDEAAKESRARAAESRSGEHFTASRSDCDPKVAVDARG